jgi:hypothetical protein
MWARAHHRQASPDALAPTDRACKRSTQRGRGSPRGGERWDPRRLTSRDKRATPRAGSRGRPRPPRRIPCPGRRRTPSALPRTTSSSQRRRRTRPLAASHRPESPIRAAPRGRAHRRRQSLLLDVSSGRSRTRTGAGSELRPAGRLRGPMAGPKFPTRFAEPINRAAFTHSGRSRTRTWDLFLIREAL